MVARWPKQLPSYSESAEKDFKLVQDVVTALRTYRTEHQLEPTQELKIALKQSNAILEQNKKLVEGLRTKATLTEGGNSEIHLNVNDGIVIVE
jgi:valyl-tRNA synthetase